MAAALRRCVIRASRRYPSLVTFIRPADWLNARTTPAMPPRWNPAIPARLIVGSLAVRYMMYRPLGDVAPPDCPRLAAGHTEPVAAARFVVQLHDATTLHFDLRLQAGQVLRSWAVPKGPSLDPAVRRLAVPVPDHDLAAGEFEGVHEGQSRGSGAVIIWDEGTAEIRTDDPAHVSFVLHGRKLSGGYALTRTGERRWILVKARDEAARPGSDIVAEDPVSVRTGRTWQEVAGR